MRGGRTKPTAGVPGRRWPRTPFYLGKQGELVGLIRKSLYFASGGAVAPNSKKQRQQAKMIAALTGGDVKRAGGRDDPFMFSARGPQLSPAQVQAQAALNARRREQAQRARDELGIPLDVPFSKLPKDQRKALRARNKDIHGEEG